jgi:transposase
MAKEVQNKFLDNTYCPLDGWVKDISIASRRLIVSYSTERAKKDYKHRMRLVERLMKKSKDGKINIKSLINNNGTKKYIQVTEGEAKLNEQKIIEDAVWDGLHGVITNYTQKEQKAQDILGKYKGLWKIEEVFRINKNDLEMRPIYHWKPSRIRAHILICFIAYTMINFAAHILEKHKLKISFDELKRELSKREVSIIRDCFTQRRYMIHNAFTDIQKNIYRSFTLPIKESIEPMFRA